MRVDWTDLSLVLLASLITIKVGVPTYNDWLISRDEGRVSRRIANLSSELEALKQERIYLQVKGEERIGVLKLPGTVDLGFGLVTGEYVEGELIEVDNDRRLVVVRGR